jgi:predicted N-acetyltransferase YhbS
MVDQEADASCVIVSLTDAFPVEDFDCGDAPRNAWLCTRALGNQASDDTRTYVALKEGVVVGFYALAVGSIVHAGMPGAIRRNAPDPISCVLLAQLAVGFPFQKRGLSRQLVLHSMNQAVKIAEIAGCRLFAVHPATPELEAYYAKYGFVRTVTTPMIMVLPLRKIRTTLAAVAAAQAGTDRQL